MVDEDEGMNYMWKNKTEQNGNENRSDYLDLFITICIFTNWEPF